MHPIKYLWALRAIIYKPFFKYIGNMSYIGRPCFVEGCRNISIGEKTRIFPGIRMEAIGDGELIIGSNCAIEQNVHLISNGQKLYIGRDTTISANVFISNVDHEYNDVSKSVMEQPLVNKTTQVGERCFIGYGASLLPGTKLGNNCIVGSNAVVKGEFPDNCVIVGAPAKIVKVYRKEKNIWERIDDN